MQNSILTKCQKKTFSKKFLENKKPHTITASVRYDDECNNGHNTFAITGEIKCNGEWISGGCLHDEIAKHFPQLAPYIKWHLVSSDEPLHYIANSLYWAEEHEPNKAWVIYNDLEIGIEEKFIRYCAIDEAIELCNKRPFNFETGNGCYMMIDKDTAKVSNFENFKASAIWPDATIEDMRDPNLKKRLKERLPGLMVEFKEAMESLSFTY